jgi:Flp pilus assembly protein TadG
VSRRRREPADQGSAVVDFALVGALLVLVLLAVVQLAVAAHVRATLVASAAEGAREAAAANRTLADGVRRSRELARETLPGADAVDVTAWYEDDAGLRTAVVQVRAPLPVLGLLGPSADVTVLGHALVEPR